MVDDLLTGLVGSATDSVEELIEAHNTVLVGIQVAKEDGGLVLGDVGAEVLQSPIELLHVNFTVAVIVHDSEGASHATNRAHAARLKASLHLVEN